MESSEVARCLGANRGRRWGPPSSRCELSIITCLQVQSSPHFRCLLCLPSRDKKSPVLGAVPGALHSPYIEFQSFLPFVVHLYLFFFFHLYPYLERYTILPIPDYWEFYPRNGIPISWHSSLLVKESIFSSWLPFYRLFSTF